MAAFAQVKVDSIGAILSVGRDDDTGAVFLEGLVEGHLVHLDLRPKESLDLGQALIDASGAF